jgi:ATP/maltotriose-dependent transcriptional regulator MalT
MPTEGQRVMTTISAAGWMSTQINLGNRPRLSAALASNDSRLYRVLLEHLPGAVQAALEGGEKDSDLVPARELLQRVVHALEAEQPLQQHQEQLILDSQRRARVSIERARDAGRLTPEQADEQITAVEDGGTKMLAEISRDLEQFHSEAPDPLEEFVVRETVAELVEKSGLSTREAEVLTLRAQDYEYVEIARMLGMNSKTVGVHLHNIRQKLRRTITTC